MRRLSSFREVLDLWPSREAVAEELGVSSRAVSKWWQRRSIPPSYWSQLLKTRTAADEGLTADCLTRLAALERV